MPVIDGDDGAARAPYTGSSPLYMMEVQTTTWVQLCMQQILCDLEIAHHLEIGTQFPDSENAQRNLEMVQNPRLRGTKVLKDEWNIIAKAHKFTVFEIL